MASKIPPYQLTHKKTLERLVKAGQILLDPSNPTKVFAIDDKFEDKGQPCEVRRENPDDEYGDLWVLPLKS